MTCVPVVFWCTQNPIAAGHTTLAALDGVDNSYSDVRLPFQLWWYGVNYTVVRVHSNGWIQVGTGVAWANDPTRGVNASHTGAGIAVFWADWCA